ncbi:MAG: hypothetical protein RL023_878 [Candidatus Parcubacteria bacterium]
MYPERFKKTFVSWLSDIKPRCISRQLRRGHRIPVRKTLDGTAYCFDEESVIQGEKNIVSSVIFNLIADGRLSNPFSLETLIELLLEPCVAPVGKLVYESYADMYSIVYQQKKSLLTKVENFRNVFEVCKS